MSDPNKQKGLSEQPSPTEREKDDADVGQDIRKTVNTAINDLLNPDSKINRAFNAITFLEEDLDREDLDNNEEKFLRFIYGKSPDIESYIQEFPEELQQEVRERINRKIIQDVQKKWKEGHQVYCPEKAKETIKTGIEIVQGIKLEEKDLEREELDDDPEAFVRYILEKEPDLKDLMKTLKGKALEAFKKEVINIAIKDRKYGEWKEGHKVYCPEKAQETIKEAEKIIKGLKFEEKDLEKEELDDDPDAFINYVLNKEPDLRDMMMTLKGKALEAFKEQIINSAIKEKKYAEWKEGHKVYCPDKAQETIREADRIIDGIKFDEKDLEREELDDNPEAFIRYIFEKEPDLRDMMETLKGKALEAFKKKIIDASLKEKKYAEWKEGHKVYCPDKAKSTIDEATKIVDRLKFSPEEIGREEFHKNQNAFLNFVLAKEPDINDLMSGLKGKALEKFKEEVYTRIKTNTYSRWEQQHEAAEKEEKKSELLKAARNEPLPSEWASEDLSESQFMQNYFDLLADKDPELLEPQHQTMRAELFQDAELQAALKLRHKDFLETKEAKVLDEAKNEMEKMTFTDDEKRREEFHDNAEEFATFVLDEKLSPEVRAKIDKLSPQKKDEYQKQLRQQAKGKLYKNWKEQHESIEEADAKSKLIDLIRNQERTPAGMKDVFASAEDFKNAMWQSALTKDKEWSEPQHKAMIARLSKDPQIVQALDARYSVYREKFQEVANREIKEEVSKIDFSPAEIDNDEFHDNEEGFAEYMYSKKLSPKLLKKIASLPGLEDITKKQLKDNTYGQWLKKHETAEEKKFTKELEEKILGQEFPPDFANTHYEAKDFQEKWFELIKGNLSDDLKNEHAEELKKLLGKDRVQNAFAKKFEAYEEVHDKAMEQKFSAELISLNASVGIPAELIQKSLTPDEFKKEWFALLLKNASPELLEELEEHAELREKLFKHQQLQVGMESHYKKYKLEHDTIQESKYSQELIAGIEAFKIPAEMMKAPLSEAQFLQEMAQRLFKTASPELQKNKDLQAALLANPKIKAQLAKKYAEYQKSLKKPEKTEEEAPEKELQKKEEMIEEKTKERLEKEAPETMEEKKKAPVKRRNAEEKLDAENIESATEEDLKDGLDKVLDMSKGQERLMELKKLPFLKNILRKNHLKRGLEPMLVEWTAQLKPADFRMFKMVLMRKGTTPEKMLQLMATTPLRRKALNRIRKFSHKTWFKFAQSIKYLNLTPAQAFQTVPVQVKPLEKQKDMLAETPLLETALEEEELFEEQTLEKEQEDFSFLEDEETVLEDQNENELQALEAALEMEKESDHLEQPLSDTTETEPEQPDQAELLEGKEETEFSSQEEPEPASSLPEQPEISAEKQPHEIQQQPPLEMEEHFQTVADEAEEQENDLKEQPLLEADDQIEEPVEEKPESGAMEPFAEQEESPVTQAEPLVEPEQPAAPASEQEISEQNLEQFVTPPANEEQSEGVLPPTPEETQDRLPVSTIDENLRTSAVPEQPLEELQQPLRKEKIPEKTPIAKKPETINTSTDPLKELEKFRKQLMKQFRRNAQLAQMQKTFELMGINIEPFYEIASEESSEFLESLRLEMETNSMSLGSLLKKFVRYVRFITDFEIPARYDISSAEQEKLLSNPAEVFKALNEHYFTCRANHEKTTEMTFTCRDLREESLDLVFEVHKNEVSQTCAAQITCSLVPGQEKTIPLAA